MGELDWGAIGGEVGLPPPPGAGNPTVHSINPEIRRRLEELNALLPEGSHFELNMPTGYGDTTPRPLSDAPGAPAPAPKPPAAAVPPQAAAPASGMNWDTIGNEVGLPPQSAPPSSPVNWDEIGKEVGLTSQAEVAPPAAPNAIADTIGAGMQMQALQGNPLDAITQGLEAMRLPASMTLAGQPQGTPEQEAARAQAEATGQPIMTATPEPPSFPHRVMSALQDYFAEEMRTDATAGSRAALEDAKTRLAHEAIQVARAGGTAWNGLVTFAQQVPEVGKALKESVMGLMGGVTASAAGAAGVPGATPDVVKSELERSRAGTQKLTEAGVGLARAPVDPWMYLATDRDRFKEMLDADPITTIAMMLPGLHRAKGLRPSSVLVSAFEKAAPKLARGEAFDLSDYSLGELNQLKKIGLAREQVASGVEGGPPEGLWKWGDEAFQTRAEKTKAGIQATEPAATEAPAPPQAEVKTVQAERRAEPAPGPREDLEQLVIKAEVEGNDAQQGAAFQEAHRALYDTVREIMQKKGIGKDNVDAVFLASQHLNDLNERLFKVQTDMGNRASAAAEAARPPIPREPTPVEQTGEPGQTVQAGAATAGGPAERAPVAAPNFTYAKKAEYPGGRVIHYWKADVDMPDGGGKAGSLVSEEVIRRNGFEPPPVPGRTVFQGRGAPLDKVYGPGREAAGTAVPVLGPGEYFAHTRKDAEFYGDVTEHPEPQLKRPFILDTDAKWNKLLQDAEATQLHSHSGALYREPASIKPATERLQKYLRDQGYDGVIVKVSWEHDMGKRIRETFGHDQTVVFDRGETPTAPAEGGPTEHAVGESLRYGKQRVVVREVLRYTEGPDQGKLAGYRVKGKHDRSPFVVKPGDVKPWGDILTKKVPRMPSIGSLDHEDLGNSEVVARFLAENGGLRRSGETEGLAETYGRSHIKGVVTKDGLEIDDMAERLADGGAFRDKDHAADWLNEWIYNGGEDKIGPSEATYLERVKSQGQRFGVDIKERRARLVTIGRDRNPLVINPREGQRGSVKPGDVVLMQDDVFRVKPDPQNPGKLMLKDGRVIRPEEGQSLQGVKVGKMPVRTREELKQAGRPVPPELRTKEAEAPPEPAENPVAPGPEPAKDPHEKLRLRVLDAKELGDILGEEPRQNANKKEIALHDELRDERRAIEMEFDRVDQEQGREAGDALRERLGWTPRDEDVLAGARRATDEAAAKAKRLAEADKLRSKTVKLKQRSLVDQEANKTLDEERRAAEQEAEFEVGQKPLLGGDEGQGYPEERPGVNRAAARPVPLDRSKPKSPQAVVRARDIRDRVEKAVLAPFRYGGFRRKALGLFYPLRRVIRLKKYMDLPVDFHEAGHALQEILFPEVDATAGFNVKGAFAKEMRRELTQMGKDLYGKRKPVGGYKSEGLAEFVRMYIEDRNEARTKAPRFFTEFENRLLADADTIEIGRVLDEAREQYRLFRDQSAVAKLGSLISVGEAKVRRWSLDRISSAIFDNQKFIEAVVKGMNGGKLPEYALGNPIAHAHMLRGWTGLPEAALMRGGGVADIRINELLRAMVEYGMQKEPFLSGASALSPTPKAARFLEDKVVASRFARFIQDGYVEQRGRSLHLTAAGRKHLAAGTFEKSGESFGDILARKGVADEAFPIVLEAAKKYEQLSPAERVLRRMSNKFADADNMRSLNKFRIYWAARRAVSIAEGDVARKYARAANVSDAVALAYVKRNPGLVREGTFRSIGVTYKEARQVIKDLETPELSKAVDDATSYSNRVLHWLVDEGMMTEGQYRKIVAHPANLTYMPLDRWFAEYGERGGGFKGRAMSGAAPDVGFLKGSDAPIIDPLETTVGNTYLIAQTVLRNRAMRMLAEFADHRSGSGWVSEHVMKPTVVTKFRLEEIKSQVDNLVTKAGGDPSTLEPEDYEMWARIFRPGTTAPSGKNVATYFSNGKEQWVEMDPEVYRAVAGLDQEAMNKFIHIFGAPARWTRAGATLTPEFMLRNLFRDPITASLLSETGTLNPLTGAVPVLTQLRGIRELVKNGDMAFRYRASGAMHASIVSLDRDYLRGQARALFTDDAALHRIAGVVHHPIEALRALGELGETGTRLGVFARDLTERGIDQNHILEAAIKSREGTTDFNRYGTALEPMARLIPFFNPGIQSVRRFGIVSGRAVGDIAQSIAALGHGELRAPEYAARYASRVLTYVVGPSVVLHYLRKASGREDDYLELPAWRRHLFWNIPLPREYAKTWGFNWASIPKPFEVGVLYGSGTELMLEQMEKSDPKGVEEFEENLMGAFTPSIVPAFLSASVENLANRKIAFDRPIMPERQAALDPRLQYGLYTSETGKLLAEGIRHLPSMVGKPVTFALKLTTKQKTVNAYDADNLIRSLTAGLGQYYVTPALDAVIRRVLGGTKEGERIGVGTASQTKARASDVPVLRGFIPRGSEKGGGLIERVYQQIADAEAAHNTYNLLDGWQKDEYLQDDEKRRLIVGYHTYQEIQQGLAAANEAIALARKNGDEDLVDHLREIQIETARNAKHRVDEAMADPTAMRAIAIDRELSRMRTEGHGRRAEAATVLESLVEQKATDERVRAYLDKMPDGEDRRWAARYIRALKRQEQLNAEREALKGASRREKFHLKERGFEVSGR